MMAGKEKKLRHMAIIMDGNGRWADKRSLPKSEGHRAGAQAVSTALANAMKFGIEYLTLYAFSTENWKRPIGEVTALMGLLEKFIDDKLPELHEKKIRLKTVGRTAGLPPGARKKLLNAIAETASYNRCTLVLALNYGGRAELADAARRIAEDAASGVLKPGKVDEKILAGYLYDPELPDIDLLVRTSGEMRISNFLLWHLAYSEFYVTECLWPDFGDDDFAAAVAAFDKRERRFGGR